MNIETDKEKTIYRHEKEEGKVTYTMSMSKKDQNGNWQTGFINVRFPKEADLPNKSKIKIHNAWLDFYLKEKATMLYIFINQYELLTEKEESKEEVEIPQNTTSKYAEDSDIQLSPEDLPF